jgi:hypothetical protein
VEVVGRCLITVIWLKKAQAGKFRVVNVHRARTRVDVVSVVFPCLCYLASYPSPRAPASSNSPRVLGRSSPSRTFARETHEGIYIIDKSRFITSAVFFKEDEAMRATCSCSDPTLPNALSSFEVSSRLRRVRASEYMHAGELSNGVRCRPMGIEMV